MKKRVLGFEGLKQGTWTYKEHKQNKGLIIPPLRGEFPPAVTYHFLCPTQHMTHDANIAGNALGLSIPVKEVKGLKESEKKVMMKIIVLGVTR